MDAYLYSSPFCPAEQVNLATGAITYLATDALGSVRGTVSSAGTITGTTSFGAWGNPHTAGGLTSITPFGYAGGYADLTGLMYLLNRYYDLTNGQFTSLDPLIAQTLQPYVYADGNPVSGTDPTGMAGWTGLYVSPAVHYSFLWGNLIGVAYRYLYLYLNDHDTNSLVIALGFSGTAGASILLRLLIRGCGDFCVIIAAALASAALWINYVNGLGNHHGVYFVGWQSAPATRWWWCGWHYWHAPFWPYYMAGPPGYQTGYVWVWHQ